MSEIAAKGIPQLATNFKKQIQIIVSNEWIRCHTRSPKVLFLRRYGKEENVFKL